MFGHTNLVRRNRIFYFRARVPKTLIGKIGRREIGRSLKTSDPQLARLRASALWARVQGLWVGLRSAVTGEEIDRLIRDWLSRALEADALGRCDITFAEGHAYPHETSLHETATRMLYNHAEDQLFDWRETVEKHDWLRASTEANILLKQHNLIVPPDSDDYKRVCMGICLAHLRLHGTSMERSAGRWEEVIGVFGVGQGDSAEAAPNPSRATSGSLSPTAPVLRNAVQEFLDERRRPGAMREKRLLDLEAALRLLVRQLGEEKCVDTITSSEIGDLRKLLLRLPSNFTKRFGPAPLDEIVKVAAAQSLPLLACSTINQKYLSLVEQFFGWCISCGYRTDNPSERIRVDERVDVSAKEERGTFEIADLNAIFHSPLFVGCKSDGRIYEPGSHRIGDYRYWLPLLGLFTGARLNELCQLQVADIRDVDSVPSIDISPMPGVKRVKSRAGHRKVPLHPDLIKCGFPQFVEIKKAEGAVRLCPRG